MELTSASMASLGKRSSKGEALFDHDMGEEDDRFKI
jgi:hypothetical protein